MYLRSLARSRWGISIVSSTLLYWKRAVLREADIDGNPNVWLEQTCGSHEDEDKNIIDHVDNPR